MRHLRRLIVAVVIAGTIAGCGTGPGGNACDHFSHVIEDINAGVLNEREIELKLWEVYDHVRGTWENRFYDVRDASSDVYELRASRGTDEWTDAVEELVEACKTVHRSYG